MRTSDTERKGIGQVPLLNPASKGSFPFSQQEEPSTLGALFSTRSIHLGAYFLLLSVTQGAAAIVNNET